MDKNQNVFLRCFPDFKITSTPDKTTWAYGKVQSVKCNFRGSAKGTIKTFDFKTGIDGVYFVNLIIYSDDGRYISMGQAGTSFTRIKLPDGNPIYPKDTDLHLFGGITKKNLQEPTPYYYDYELINIHTGYVGENSILGTKPGFKKYKKFKNKPMVALGENGLDAISCGNQKSASFWNGKNFACLKWLSLDND